jgi:hypothetical protein
MEPVKVTVTEEEGGVSVEVRCTGTSSEEQSGSAQSAAIRWAIRALLHSLRTQGRCAGCPALIVPDGEFCEVKKAIRAGDLNKVDEWSKRPDMVDHDFSGAVRAYDLMKRLSANLRDLLSGADVAPDDAPKAREDHTPMNVVKALDDEDLPKNLKALFGGVIGGLGKVDEDPKGPGPVEGGGS